MEVFLGITIGLCFGLFIIAVFSAGFAFFAYSKVVGFENSTHNVSYVDPYADEEKEVEEEEENFPMPLTLQEIKDREFAQEVKEEKERKQFDRDSRKAFGFTEEEQDSVI